MSRRVDIGISLAVVSLGVLLLVLAQTVRHGSIDDPIREGGVPTVVALILIIGGATLVVQEVRSWRSPELPAGVPDNPTHGPASAFRAGAVFVSLAVYAAALPLLGFLIATPAFVAAAMWLLEVRSPLKLAVASIGFTLVTFLFFVSVLGIRLPPGFLRIGV